MSMQSAQRPAREICERYSLPTGPRNLLKDDPPMLLFLDRLLADETLLSDAIEFLAHSLPPRAAVWWGALCIELFRGNDLSPAEDVALAAAVAWAREPTEKHALEVCDTALCSGGQALLGTSADQTASNVSLAIQLALHKGPAAEQLVSAYRACIALGIAIAQEKHLGPLAAAASGKGTGKTGR
jgi:hypothetical protein